MEINETTERDNRQNKLRDTEAKSVQIDMQQFEQETHNLAISGGLHNNWKEIARSNALRKKVKEHNERIVS